MAITERNLALKTQLATLQAALMKGVVNKRDEKYLDSLRRQIADTRLQMKQSK